MSQTAQYRVRNWSQYNRSLIYRGNVTVWFSDDVLLGWSSTSKPSPGMATGNHNIQACWTIGGDNWKKVSHYHQRSLAETGMFRFKTIFGPKLSARKEGNQIAEALIKSRIMNRLTHFGMPDSYRKS